MLSSIPSEKRGTIYGLYALDGPDQKIRYVGQTIQKMKRRFWHHQGDARAGSTWPVHAWMRKHGLDCVTYRILEKCSIESIDGRECFWIDRLKTHTEHGGLNLTSGGAGVHGWKASDETRANMSVAVQKRKWKVAAKISGTGMPTAVLTEESARVAKELLWDGYGPTEVASLIGASPAVIKNVNKDRTWKHVPWPIGPRRILRAEHISTNHSLKSTPLELDDVRAIRRMGNEGFSTREIVDAIGGFANPHNVRHITSGRGWKHVA